MFQANEPSSWIVGVAACIILLMGVLLWVFVSAYISDFKAVKLQVEKHDLEIAKLKALENSKMTVLDEIKNGLERLSNRVDKALEEITHLRIEHEKMKAKCELHTRE